MSSGVRPRSDPFLESRRETGRRPAQRSHDGLRRPCASTGTCRTGNSTCVRTVLLQRLQLDAPEINLRPLRLDHDLSLTERSIGRGIHELPVDEVGEVAALDDGLDVGPFEAGTLDV